VSEDRQILSVPTKPNGTSKSAQGGAEGFDCNPWEIKSPRGCLDYAKPVGKVGPGTRSGLYAPNAILGIYKRATTSRMVRGLYCR